MRSGRKSILAIGIGFIFIILVCLMALAIPRQTKASAFTGNSPNFTDNYTREDFLSETNTYSATNVNQSTLEMTYNMSAKNSLSVLAVPQITVLTHGLSGDAGHWSNAYSATNTETDFEYDPNSLINKLSMQAGGANVYWAVMQANKEYFDLYDLDIQNYNGKYLTENLVPKDSIDNITKHIIVVFQAGDNGGYNDSVYYEFNFMLSRIVYDVKCLNGGILPKINLIGHSRGGITNLQYALDHPDLVASLVSIGTPYFGTTTGVLATLFNSSPGREDVTDFDKITTYNTRWNNNYDSLYSKINAVAIGGYSSIEFLAEAIWNDVSGTIPNDAAKIACGALVERIGLACSTQDFILLKIAVTELLEYFFPTSAAASLAHILYEEISFDLSQPLSPWPPFVRMSWFNDICLHLESQLGYSGSMPGLSNYKGFNRLTRYFDVNDGTDFSKVSMVQVPVGHNLEARDAQIISWIVDRVSVMPVMPMFTTNNLSSNEVEVTGTTININGALVIPAQINGKTVTKIGDSAFAGKTGITNVSIPATVNSIGSLAFWWCTGLTNMTIPDNGVSIGTGAFSDCTGLTKFDVPNSVTSIGSGAFSGCSNLSSISIPFVGESPISSNSNFGYIFGAGSYISQNDYIPYSLQTVNITNATNIGVNAFDGCADLKSIAINNGVSNIGNLAFRECSGLVAITIPKSVTSLGEGIFYGCNNLTLVSIPFVGATLNGTNNTNFGYIFEYALHTNIPSTLKTVIITGGNSIKTDAFYNCQNITSISIPNSTTSIGTSAFENCVALTNIDIPSSITSIGYYAFYNCTSLEKVNISRTAASGITTLGGNAFEGCNQLTKIIVPSPIYKTANNWLSYANKIYSTATTTGLSYTLINDGSAYSVSKGTAIESSIEIPDIYRDKPVAEIDVAGFQNYGLVSISLPTRLTSISQYAFSGCTSLQNLTLPISIDSIGAYAFQSCTTLSNITFPINLATIGAYAFYGCSSLTSITIPSSTTSIGTSAFANCSNLEIVRLNRISSLGITSLGTNGFGGTTFLSAIYVPDTTTQVAYKAAANWVVYGSVIFAENGTVGLNYTLINNNTSYSVSVGTATANNITIPESYNGLLVTAIANSAFSQKTNITSITIPSSVTSIGMSTFSACTGLTNITIPSSVINLGDGAFQNCSGLISVTLSSA